MNSKAYQPMNTPDDWKEIALMLSSTRWPDRRTARVLSTMALYWMEINPTPWDSLFADLRGLLKDYFPEAVFLRAEYLTAESVEHRAELNQHICAASEHWNFSRITPITRAILYIALVEMIYDGLDPALIINEAVEIAKCFAEENAYRFVNGVLDGVRAGFTRA